MEPTSDILRKFYRDVWENGNFSAIPHYFEPETGGDILVTDRAVELHEVREWMDVLRARVTNIRVTFIHTLDQGDWASAFLEVRCNCRRTDKPVVVYQHVMSRQRDGRIVESYPQLDLLRLFKQLDLLPEDAYPLLMGGTRLS